MAWECMQKACFSRIAASRWGGSSRDRLTGNSYRRGFFPPGYTSSLKNTSALSVGESLLTGRRNYLMIILTFAALEAGCSTFVAQ